MSAYVEIRSNDFWVKVVDMLQQNWALIENNADRITIYFISDTGSVFDEIIYSSARSAVSELRKNGFWRYAEDKKSQLFIYPPEPPFYRKPHPNGPIYSSGRFWMK